MLRPSLLFSLPEDMNKKEEKGRESLACLFALFVL